MLNKAVILGSRHLQADKRKVITVKFKKAPIEILMRGTKKSPPYIDVQDGYTFEYMFSNGHLHTLGVYKDLAKDALHKTRWIVTDLGTGYAVCDGETRAEAVQKVFDVYGSKLERMVFSNVHYPQRDSFTNQYEFMCDEFRAMRQVS